MKSIPSGILLAVLTNAIGDRRKLLIDDFLIHLGATAITGITIDQEEGLDF
jgi:hypothetical protein